MVDLRDRLTPVKDQGRRGTCVAFAATAGHEMLRKDGEDLCEEFLHWAAKQRDGLPKLTEGTTLASATEALTELGQPPEDVWPYDENRDQWAAHYTPPQGACAAAKCRRVVTIVKVQPVSAALRRALDAGVAVLLGVQLYATWHYPDAHGQIDMPPRGVPPLGGHAVLLVGYRPSNVEGEGQFIVRNSWGGDWADRGYGYLPYGYVDRYGLQAWGLAE